MVDRICLFEGPEYARLLPLVYFCPQYDLRCGILTIREKYMQIFPSIPISLHCRTYLSDFLIQQNPSVEVNAVSGTSCLFIYGTVLPDETFRKTVVPEGPDCIFFHEKQIVAARLSGINLENMKRKLGNTISLSDFPDVPNVEIAAKVMKYPWDFVQNNGAQITSDYKLLTGNVDTFHKGKIYENATLVCPENIFIDEGAKIKPGAILDAEDGPIYIGRNANIMHNSVIIGPSYVGERSAIKIGAKIYENSSIGPVCKVGGEVEDTIIHSYSNKQHDGFLGHAYLGKWVNLGADTNNSDLKNNYGSVRVYINDEEVNSGSMFVGLTMGDHSKSAINTMFNTGTVVGVSSNVFGAGFPEKYIPSFAWGGAEGMKTYKLETAIDVAKRVMARRKVELTPVEQEVFRAVFQLTLNERSRRAMGS